MPTMEVLRPRSAIDVCYCSEYPRVITRPIPVELLPVACWACGAKVEDWRIKLDESPLCARCCKKLAKLRKQAKPVKQEPESSAVLQMLAAWRVGKEKTKADDAMGIVRRCRWAVRKYAVRNGANLGSPVTRETLRDATGDVVTEYYRRLSGIEAGKTISVWRIINYAVREVFRSDRESGIRYLVSQDSASFGDLVAKPVVPRGFRPLSSYSHSWELLEPLRAEIAKVLAALGQQGEFDLLDASAMLQEKAPELWAGIAYRVLGES